jgi:hypothetical protein
MANELDRVPRRAPDGTLYVTAGDAALPTAASLTGFTPAGGLAPNDVQAAIVEVAGLIPAPAVDSAGNFFVQFKNTDFGMDPVQFFGTADLVFGAKIPVAAHIHCPSGELGQSFDIFLQYDDFTTTTIATGWQTGLTAAADVVMVPITAGGPLGFEMVAGGIEIDGVALTPGLLSNAGNDCYMTLHFGRP